MRVNNISPEEWDFRKIPENLAKDAILYEYWRSNASACPTLTKLLDTILPVKHPYFPPKISFREILFHHDIGDLDVFEHVMNYVPEDLPDGALSLIAKYPSFPKPFSLGSMETLKGDEQIVPISFFELKKAPFKAKAFLINERSSQSEVIASFRIWIKENCDFERGRGIHKGRFFDDLKALAAFRLATVGHCSQSEANDLIQERLKLMPDASTNHVLPKYDSKQSWDRAVEKAEINIFKSFTSRNS